MCICVYVYMYTYIIIFFHTCIYICTYVHERVCLTRINKRKHVRTHIPKHIHACVNISQWNENFLSRLVLCPCPRASRRYPDTLCMSGTTTVSVEYACIHIWSYIYPYRCIYILINIHARTRTHTRHTLLQITFKNVQIYCTYRYVCVYLHKHCPYEVINT